MIQSPTISPNPPQLKSMDYSFLRKKGIEYIQKIAGKLWTDFNIHDPGVTILEILCYAISDLGYRSSYPIEDLLASHPAKRDSILKDFHQAAEILSTRPYSREDYRKLLIDIPGIRNAWIEKSLESEKPVYFNEVTDALDATTGSNISLNGLYRIRLEFEDDAILGDLNTNILKDSFEITTGSETVHYTVEATMPYWDELGGSWHRENYISTITLEDSIVVLQEERYDDYYAEFTVLFDDDTLESNVPVKIKILPSIDKSDTALNADVVAALETLFSRINSGSLFFRFREKVAAIYHIVDEAKNTMNGHRNLCEDYFIFEASRIQEIGIKARIEIRSDADPEETLADVYFSIDQFFSPHIRFRSLTEMVNEGWSTDEIFDGPHLRHGFIKTDDLKTLKRKNILYTSDLVHEMMNIDDVNAVSNLTITNYIFNQSVIENEPNCITYTAVDRYKPKLSIDKSKIQVTKDGSPIETNKEDIKQKVHQLKIRSLDNTAVENALTLTIPQGKDRSVNEYYSIQYHFPQTYGIGEHEPGDNVSEQRKARVRQLQGYLQFFEQLLANYFSQLAHVRDLFSTDPDIRHTYFSQPLFDVPAVKELFKEFTDSEMSWEEFISDNSVYRNQLSNSVEDESLFVNRRNRFLDHLCARFCEDFTDYALHMYANTESGAEQKLIHDKRVFLDEYVMISRDRSAAFDYTSKKGDTPDVWNSSNVSGIEKRIARLLGICNYKRRFLHNEISNYFQIYEELDTDSIVEYRFRLFDDDNNILLSSSTRYTDMVAMEEVMEKVVTFGIRRDRYEIITAGSGDFYFSLLDDTDDIIARRIEPFTTIEEALEAIDTVLNFMVDKYGGEGFHLIEHILLRPKNNSYRMMPIAPVNITHDPYSFQVTIVIPDFSERFQNNDFRRLITKVINSEVPAHIMAHVLWLDRQDIESFEQVYKAWLESFCDDTVSEEQKIMDHESLICWFEERLSPVTSPG